jgi:hypothetical protein
MGLIYHSTGKLEKGNGLKMQLEKNQERSPVPTHFASALQRFLLNPPVGTTF